MGTKRTRFELSPAEIHGGPEGLFRVRVDRRWHDGPEGEALFLDRDGLAHLVASAALGTVGSPAPRPSLRRGSRISVRIEDEGRARVEGGFTVGPFILAHDGRWMVPVTVYGGTRYVAAEDIVAKEERL
jgi:hypothetical protein